MTLAIRHFEYPVPTPFDLAVAIGRIADVRVRIALLILLWIGGWIAPSGWWDAGIPVVTFALGISIGSSTGPIVRDWRVVRRRRLFLNGSRARFDRSTSLVEALVSLTEEAGRAWQRYITEATAGSVRYGHDDGSYGDMSKALEPLMDTRRLADRFGIIIDGELAGEGMPRLPVPTAEAFVPAPPSPTMAGFNAAAMAAARAQAMAQSEQRHRKMLAAAARYEPHLRFAQDVLRMLVDAAADPSTGQRQSGSTADADLEPQKPALEFREDHAL